MFDSVGRDLDDDALQRSAKSAGLVSLLTGGGVALFVISGYIFVTEIAPELPLTEIIMEEFVEEAAMEAPPPPPPPPPAAAAPEEEQEEEVEPTPDDMVEKVDELKEEVKEEMKSDVKPAGVEGGQEGGQVGGVVGGVQGGVEGGVIGGTGTGPPPPPPPAYKTIRAGEVEWKVKTTPEYPEAAKGMGYGETSCVATVFLSADGIVEKIQVADSCPKPFQTALQTTVMKWKAYPFKVDGQKIATSYKGNFIFKEQ